jgi:general secretion pathway protein B
MSFILDALRKSENERQRSAAPGLSQVPLAAPAAQLPRWALLVIGLLAAAVLVLGGAWWQSMRAPVRVAATPLPMVERSVELPPPAPVTPPQPARPFVADPAEQSRGAALANAADAGATDPTPSFAGEELAARETQPMPLTARTEPAATRNEPALPSAAALIADGVALPRLRLELHAYSEQPRDRFVFVNGRKYVEGERLVEGPELVSIERTGAVLSHAGHRFLLIAE